MRTPDPDIHPLLYDSAKGYSVAMPQPRISVIIPTRNRAALLREAIASVYALPQAGYELEVLVADNGSTDATAAIARSFPVRYLAATDGRGASVARNAGLAAATGDYIAFLDDDDLYLPNALAAQLAMLRAHPEYGAVFAQTQLTDAARVPYGEPLPPGPARSGWLHEELLAYWPQLGSALIRAEVARAAGDFDPALPGDQDWDWLLRVARVAQIGRVAVPVVLFRQRARDDEALYWRRFRCFHVVWRRHIRAYSLPRRLRLLRVYWAHRGWYAAYLLRAAGRHAAERAWGRAARCLGYALRASPPHTLRLLAVAAISRVRATRGAARSTSQARPAQAPVVENLEKGVSR